MEAVLTHEDGETVVNAEVKDNGDGTYTSTYPGATKAGTYCLTFLSLTHLFSHKYTGTYTIAPTINGEPIKDAPFTVEVEPTTADGSFCIASGPGIEKANVGGTATTTATTKPNSSNTIVLPF